MKKLLVLLLILPSYHAWSQSQQNEKDFLNWFFTTQRKAQNELLYFADHSKYDADKMKQVLLTDTIIDRLAIAGRDRQPNILILSKRDHRYIQEKIAQFASHQWASQILPKARIINRDTISTYFKHRPYDGWTALYAKKIFGYYSFTRPIFLNHGTICIFKYDYSCGSLCGDGEIILYRKEKSGWKPFIVLDSWIS